MVHCSMMPVASGPGAPAPRPKLGFSIDSLVGEGAAAAPRSSDPAPAPSASPEPPRRRERSPPAARRAEQTQTLELQQAHQQQVAQHQELLDTDMLQQRLAHERALHERLLAHGLGAAAGPLAAFGGPLAPLARLPLADPRYMKLAQLRGELALQGRAGGGGGVPSGLHSLLAGPHPHPPAGAHPHPAAPSEMPLYPWLMSRHGRVFPGRYAPGPHLPEFLFQPFRKPKRIRTAFSPTQLLKLEHAFEKNHYVVGQERKQLAQTLSLSETQVKVWFQNRRTKHKRSSDGTDGGEGGEGGEGADGADGDAAEGADAGEGSEGGAMSEEGGRSADPGVESDSDSDDNAGVGIDVTN